MQKKYVYNRKKRRLDKTIQTGQEKKFKTELILHANS